MFDWTDFEEDESSDAIAGKFILTIWDGEGEEFAVIVHRMTPNLDNASIMNHKRRNAQMIIDAMNAAY